MVTLVLRPKCVALTEYINMLVFIAAPTLLTAEVNVCILSVVHWHNSSLLHLTWSILSIGASAVGNVCIHIINHTREPPLYCCTSDL